MITRSNWWWFGSVVLATALGTRLAPTMAALRSRAKAGVLQLQRNAERPERHGCGSGGASRRDRAGRRGLAGLSDLFLKVPPEELAKLPRDASSLAAGIPGEEAAPVADSERTAKVDAMARWLHGYLRDADCHCRWYVDHILVSAESSSEGESERR